MLKFVWTYLSINNLDIRDVDIKDANVGISDEYFDLVTILYNVALDEYFVSNNESVRFRNISW